MDATNRQILDLLQNDARAPIKTIAAKVGLARSSVRERIARMEAAGIIRGYRVELGSEATAQTAVQAIMLLRFDKTPVPRTIAKITANPEVVRCVSVGGDIDVAVEAHIASVEALNRLRDEVAGYPHVIDVTTMLILKREKG
ncbi:DNA-binding Lrp family transcriptional regulator [Povalibacter uvarum]|uniref:DNA-binding Lrp family transcriptional regulator n=1 Tax=Povalibacter uvarum TaxID=732238 RepID=A0A841HKG7_9GAMM|nr:Lrp/AsnC family transcriptional regulator [Povalibacter uvarum]MBB6093223.1 DNA-binding Lrp family transcriptional regulator [Povalibacter uvarum]